MRFQLENSSGGGIHAMAIGALHRRLAIPPEWQPGATGLDDVAWAQRTDPTLTTVAVDAATIGAAPATVRLRRS